MVLQGKSSFVKQWLYYQPWIALFNDPKQAGDVLSRIWYRDLLVFGVFSGAAVPSKRFAIGLRFGKASYTRYSEELSKVLKQTLTMTKLSQFAERWKDMRHNSAHSDAVEDASRSIDAWLNQSTLVDDNDRLKEFKAQDARTMTVSQRVEIDQLLGEWEDIELMNNEVEEPS